MGEALDYSECVLRTVEHDYAALLARHNALVEAVKKMLYADKPGVWDAQTFKAARAEVDRLLAEEDVT